MPNPLRLTLDLVRSVIAVNFQQQLSDTQFLSVKLCAVLLKELLQPFVCQLMSQTGQPLSQMLEKCMDAYPVSGEINRIVDDPDKVIACIERHYGDMDCEKDYTDGLSMSFKGFRFNVRKSNTEPILRLNVESRGDRALMQDKTDELLQLIKGRPQEH